MQMIEGYEPKHFVLDNKLFRFEVVDIHAPLKAIFEEFLKNFHLS